MSLREKIRSYFERIREKHKLTFIDDATYDEKWSFRVSTLNLITLLGLYTIIIVTTLFFLIKFTPLGGFFMDSSSNPETIAQVEDNAEQIDSLNAWTRSNQIYLENLFRILNDEPFEDSLSQLNDSIFLNYQPDFTKSKEDSILRDRMEQSNTQDASGTNRTTGIFYSPVKGTVSKSFNPKKGHLGVDVVTAADEAIKSCLNGTVIFAGWSPDDGNMVIVQHAENLISIYKHCSVLLKTTGDPVREGDPIGIVGNTGETSTGPHLHFELWQRGNPLNPQEFISFSEW